MTWKDKRMMTPEEWSERERDKEREVERERQLGEGEL